MWAITGPLTCPGLALSVGSESSEGSVNEMSCSSVAVVRTCGSYGVVFRSTAEVRGEECWRLGNVASALLKYIESFSWQKKILEKRLHITAAFTATFCLYCFPSLSCNTHCFFITYWIKSRCKFHSVSQKSDLFHAMFLSYQAQCIRFAYLVGEMSDAFIHPASSHGTKLGFRLLTICLAHRQLHISNVFQTQQH